MKIRPIVTLFALALVGAFTACTTTQESGHCPSHCSTITGKKGTSFDERGIVRKADPNTCKGPAKYILDVHGKTALLEPTKATESKLAALAGKKTTAHVVGTWEECGTSKCLCVHVTSVHNSSGKTATKSADTAEKPAEAKPAAAGATDKHEESAPATKPAAAAEPAVEKPAEAKPADEKPAAK